MHIFGTTDGDFQLAGSWHIMCMKPWPKPKAWAGFGFWWPKAWAWILLGPVQAKLSWHITTSIWANVMFSIKQAMSGEISLLTIRGLFPAGDKAMCKFFLSLLYDWDHIWSFHVFRHQGWRIGQGTFDILYKPTLQLESFLLTFKFNHEPSFIIYILLMRRPIFSDHTPKLWKLHCPEISFNLDTQCGQGTCVWFPFPLVLPLVRSFGHSIPAFTGAPWVRLWTNAYKWWWMMSPGPHVPCL